MNESLERIHRRPARLVRDRSAVTVRVEDGQGGSVTIAVNIGLDDVVEPPEAPDPPTFPDTTLDSLTVSWTAPANTGPPINDYDVQYRAGNTGDFAPWSHDGTGTSTRITGLRTNTQYQVQVRAVNAEDAGPWSASGEATTSPNQPPIFDDGSSARRELPENTVDEGLPFGDPVTASDPEGGTLSYGVEGTDAGAFGIDADTGRVLTAHSGDYEEWGLGALVRRDAPAIVRRHLGVPP